VFRVLRQDGAQEGALGQRARGETAELVRGRVHLLLLAFALRYRRDFDHEVRGIGQKLFGELHAQYTGFFAVAVGVQALRAREQHVPRVVTLPHVRKQAFAVAVVGLLLLVGGGGVERRCLLGVVEVDVVLVARVGRF
jgi:hypothetical protein